MVFRQRFHCTAISWSFDSVSTIPAISWSFDSVSTLHVISCTFRQRFHCTRNLMVHRQRFHCTCNLVLLFFRQLFYFSHDLSTALQLYLQSLVHIYVPILMIRAAREYVSMHGQDYGPRRACIRVSLRQFCLISLSDVTRFWRLDRCAVCKTDTLKSPPPKHHHEHKQG